jgi:hypothetical protein
MNATAKPPTDQQVELVSQVMDNLAKLGKKDIGAEVRRLTVKPTGEMLSEYELRRLNLALKKLFTELHPEKPKPEFADN